MAEEILPGESTGGGLAAGCGGACPSWRASFPLMMGARSGGTLLGGWIPAGGQGKLGTIVLLTAGTTILTQEFCFVGFLKGIDKFRLLERESETCRAASLGA